MVLRLCSVLLFSLVACPRSGAPTGAVPAARSEAAPDIDRPGLAAEALATAVKQELTPTEFGPGASLLDLDPAVSPAFTPWALDPDTEDPRPVEITDELFATEPWATLDANGTLTLQWETVVPSPPGLVYLGSRVEADAWALPRHRRTRRASGDGPAKVHQASYGAMGLLRGYADYDVDGVIERGYGELVWRVEQFDPRTGSTALHDGRTAFSLSDGVWTQAPTVVLGPTLHRVDDDSYIVAVETDVPTAAVLTWASASATGSVRSQAPSTRHELRVDGLPASSEIAYAVGVSDGVAASTTPTVRTRTRDPSAQVKLAIMSDSRSGVGPGLESYGGVNALALHGLFVQAGRRRADAILFPGDLIDGYVTVPEVYDRQLRQWLRTVEGVHGSIPVYTGMGNHEALIDAWSDQRLVDKRGADSAEARFAALMVNPENGPAAAPGQPTYDESVYSFDIGPVHVAFLNTNYAYAWPIDEAGSERIPAWASREGLPTEAQLAWLDADLAAARARGQEHLLVLSHEPAFPAGGHARDAMWWGGEVPSVNAVRERFWTLLARHEVVAYVSGDEHNYSRALIGPETVEGAPGSVWSIISGGCGAPYYAQDTPAEYADRVQAFSAQQHLTLWTFGPDSIQLDVLGLTGETIESIELLGALRSGPTGTR